MERRKTSVGYAGSSEPEAHFGLGTSVESEDVWQIDLLSGGHQVIENLAAALVASKSTNHDRSD